MRRDGVLDALRRAALRQDSEGTATLLAIAVRGYLRERRVSHAFKLLERTPLARERVSASQQARLLYYQGRIKAVQLDYSAAHSCLQQALRKAPRTVRTFLLLLLLVCVSKLYFDLLSIDRALEDFV